MGIAALVCCPNCRNSLEPTETEEGGTSLSCPRCGNRYGVESGMPRMLFAGIPGLESKLREIDGWVALAQADGWYEPDDAVDAHLPVLCRDLGWDNPVWQATEHSFSLLLERYLQPGMRVLEVGAAKCWAAPHVIRKDCEYVGTDILADASIGLGRGAYFEGLAGPFSRVQADAEHLPFPDRCFDLVFCVAALHHALDMPRMVAEMRRVTRRGGVVASLNEGTRSRQGASRAPGQERELSFGINEHVHTLGSYLAAYLRAGLLATRIERADGYAMFANRTRYQKLFRVPGGRTAVTACFSLRGGFSGISIFARRP